MSTLLFVPRTPIVTPPFSTVFSGTSDEDPVSQGGIWVNGETDGVNWSDVAITNGIAHGRHNGVQFRDPTAILIGDWPSDQEAEGVITGVDTQGALCGQEVEIRLRSLVSPGVNRGYEIFWATRTSSNYFEVARWNGDPDDFTQLVAPFDPGVAPVNGRMIRARATGSNPVVLTWWIIDTDGSTVLHTSSFNDSAAERWTDGNPGMGFYIGTSCLGSLGDEHLFGFTSFAARAA